MSITRSVLIVQYAENETNWPVHRERIAEGSPAHYRLVQTNLQRKKLAKQLITEASKRNTGGAHTRAICWWEEGDEELWEYESVPER